MADLFDKLMLLALLGGAGGLVYVFGRRWFGAPDTSTPAQVQPVVYHPPDIAPLTGWQPPAKAAPFMPAFRRAEQDNGIPTNLLARQAQAESNYNPRAVSSAGAIGLMQFMPATAAEWGVDPWDAQSSIDGAGRYMAWLYKRTNSWQLALAAYNWGIGNIQRKGYSAAPSETRRYVASITHDVPVA